MDILVTGHYLLFTWLLVVSDAALRLFSAHQTWKMWKSGYIAMELPVNLAFKCLNEQHTNCSLTFIPSKMWHASDHTSQRLKYATWENRHTGVALFDICLNYYSLSWNDCLTYIPRSIWKDHLVFAISSFFFSAFCFAYYEQILSWSKYS
jgi:hypothetical protein